MSAYNKAFWAEVDSTTGLLTLSTGKEFHEYGIDIGTGMSAKSTNRLFNEFSRKVRDRYQWQKAFKEAVGFKKQYIVQVSISKQDIEDFELRRQAYLTIMNKRQAKVSSLTKEYLKSEECSSIGWGEKEARDFVLNAMIDEEVINLAKYLKAKREKFGKLDSPGHSRLNLMEKGGGRKGICIHMYTGGWAITRARHVAGAEGQTWYPYIAYEKDISPLAAKGILQRFVELVSYQASYTTWNAPWLNKLVSKNPKWRLPGSKYRLNCTTVVFDLLNHAKVASGKGKLMKDKEMYKQQFASPERLGEVMASKKWKKKAKYALPETPTGEPFRDFPGNVESRRSKLKNLEKIGSKTRKEQRSSQQEIEIEIGEPPPPLLLEKFTVSTKESIALKGMEAVFDDIAKGNFQLKKVTTKVKTGYKK